MISIQTNVDSLIAQQNLNVDNNFQSNTIQQLTSGYRINRSGDDAAGLAVANGLESQITQLTQGVNNANDGVSQLQIVDGGLSNISTILNRLQTLATESASNTFTGNRATLDQEYSGLLSEISRQASNINLSQGGSFNTALNVFIGGGSDATNSSVSINLGGAENAVDANSLGLSDTNVLGGGSGFTGNSVSLDGSTFLTSSASESFKFNAVVNGQAVTKTVTVTGAPSGISGSDVLAQLNNQLGSDQLGITASKASNGSLVFSSSNAFNVTDTAGTAATLLSSGSTTNTSNTTNYVSSGATSFTVPTGTHSETLSFQTAGQTFSVALNSSNAATLTAAINTINNTTSQYGVYAVFNSAGTGIDLQSGSTFTVSDAFAGGSAGVYGASGQATITAPTTSVTSNAQAAITAIGTAIQRLGLVQGVVGAGENTLNYAINLAQSQITNFSSAEASIKDANVAEQAANLSKSQVLTQTAVAALAQANSETQAVLKLLQ